MRTIGGPVAAVRRQEGRIGRAWRRVSKSATPMIMKRGASSHEDLIRCVTVTTGNKG